MTAIFSINDENESAVFDPPPDPPIALPIIIGLSKSPQSSQKILEEALLQFQASVKIARWLLRVCFRRLKSKRNQDSQHLKTNFVSSNLLSTPCHSLHWIFRCLFSPSIRVRQYATAVILEGWRASQQDADTHRKQTAILFELILYLVDLSLRTESTFSSRSLGHVDRAEGGDPALQLFGLLNFLLSGANISEGETKEGDSKTNSSSFGRALANTVKNKKRKANLLSRSGTEETQSSILAEFSPTLNALKKNALKLAKERKKKRLSKQKFTQENSASIYIIKRFMVGGGLRWIASSALHLIAHLLSSIEQGSLSEISRNAINLRLVLLIDLCNQLFTCDQQQSSDLPISIHSFFWSSKLPASTVRDVPLSSLAIFICIQEIIKNGKYGHISAQSAGNPQFSRKGAEKILSSLARMIDPKANYINSTSPDLTRSSTSQSAQSFTNTRNLFTRKRQRLLSTTSRTRPSSSHVDRDASTLETLRANMPLSFAFGRSGRNKRNTSDAVAAAVSAAMSGLGEDIEDLDVIDEEHSEDEEDENQCDDENSDNNGDQEGIEDAMIILEDDNGDVHIEDDIGDQEDDEEEKDSDVDDHSDSEALGRTEDIVIDGLANDDLHEENLPSPMDFGVSEMDLDDDRRSASYAVLAGSSNPLDYFNALKPKSSKVLTLPDKDPCVDRKHTYLSAAMQVLEAQHAPFLQVTTKKTTNYHSFNVTTPLLSPYSERSLLQSMCDIVKPPPKPLNLKIYMRRAPSQEEFFRGSLSKNPISISSLAASSFSGQSGDSDSAYEPTFKDLRKHIADDLQMSDSAELLELLVAKKIINMSLKLRVVQQVLWRRFVLDNSNSNDLSLTGSSGYTSETETSSLPAMIVTYRLAGVDGEATEDKVEEGDLVDPLASSENNSDTIEKEYGITRKITEKRGIPVILKSIELDIGDTLRRIRRDNVKKRRNGKLVKNPSLAEFGQSPVTSGLVLLRHCARLKDNRREMVRARAPSLLLRLLLDVLNTIDKGTSIISKTNEKISSLDSISNDQANGNATNMSNLSNNREGNNPTANALQELIEILASDISGNAESGVVSKVSEDKDVEDLEDLEDVTLPLLLSSLKKSCLSAGFRLVIANLLPFLTYGQKSLSRILAFEFVEHVNFDCLTEKENASPLMMTFIDAAINLPPVEVCNTLRLQLLAEGFVIKVVGFILKTVPNEAPSWSPALLPKDMSGKTDKKRNEELWRKYLSREGLHKAFEILIGISKLHVETQCFIAEKNYIVRTCHWIENTSDTSAGIDLGGMGLLAETLLDTLKENNEKVDLLVQNYRKATKKRKKEIAEERRNRALVGMKAFGNFPKLESKPLSQNIVQNNTSAQNNSFASIISSVFGSSSRDDIGTMSNNAAKSEILSNNNSKKVESKKVSSTNKPSWLAEMEAMEDEEGLTCAVCHEGVTFKPTDLLGLYCFVKKVTLTHKKGGTKTFIDGTYLFLSLPDTLPDALIGSLISELYFRSAKDIAKRLASSSSGSGHAASLMASTSLLSSRPSTFITTVSAGTAIHCNCHVRARQADRNHPKAPKSEWDGATLRNSRVKCNIILPLVTSNSTQVPLVAVESGLADYQSGLANTLGGRPKSMLWTVLHDVRLLLLRIAYGEPLNADCGGGSLASNTSLVFYLLCMAKMYSKHAEHGTPTIAQHVKGLSGAFICASEILTVKESARLHRATADSAPMACICSIIFFRSDEEDDTHKVITPDKRQWSSYKHLFFRGLMRCAGRREACGIEGSGCVSGRSGKRGRSNSFAELDSEDEQKGKKLDSTIEGQNESTTSTIEDYADALRPLITLFAMFDTISTQFEANMNDDQVTKSAEKLSQKVGKCHQAKSIKMLLKEAGICFSNDEIIGMFQNRLNPF